MQRGWSQALLSGAQGQDQRQQAQTETREVPCERQETPFCCEGDQALAQVAQGGCGISILGGIQKLRGHSPGQPGLGGLA